MSNRQFKSILNFPFYSSSGNGHSIKRRPTLSPEVSYFTRYTKVITDNIFDEIKLSFALHGNIKHVKKS